MTAGIPYRANWRLKWDAFVRPVRGVWIETNGYCRYKSRKRYCAHPDAAGKNYSKG